MYRIETEELLILVFPRSLTSQYDRVSTIGVTSDYRKSIVSYIVVIKKKSVVDTYNLFTTRAT
jgi:hypothetical protein